MRLRYESVAKSKRKQEIEEIYTSSFSKEDRMPFRMMLLMSYLWNTEFFAFYDGDTLCGFVYLGSIRKITFVMFFAVVENLQSKGYGGHILDEVQALHPNQKIIISIEPCDEHAEDFKQRVRRKKFYLKNGFAKTGYYIRLGGKEQEVLIKNGTFDKWEFTRFFMIYSNLTMMPKMRKTAQA